ncbi:hypothetical protein X797_003676 [Metarhizium robertsii]|uniref:Uncharacterized protein n=2 Tax=Metarhizium robertsii TaxID=568076 RepID=E9EV40_METRA|nr:uncharacterized protein MAA_03889 [Metarhizium robertsii ARSEF 23]EFZ00112.1 hypothetical protein MAA_03889 [Metarhizium robertsii ARSEF 23]EXV02555.1 hypothetical protein X797_003676 [Metarhizium robertsii]
MEDGLATQNLIIILATIIPSFMLIALAALLYYRTRRRKARLFNRGITPIDDEEIESWKVDRGGSEKPCMQEESQKDQSSPSSHRTHRPSTSVGSVQKPTSLIVYQSSSQHISRMSEDRPMAMYLSGKGSLELPQIPVLARAPNSRPGLTDDTVQGEDAFISYPKRYPSRLAKAPPLISPRHGRSKSTRATVSPREPWYSQSQDDQLPPRRSADTFLRILPSGRRESDGVYSSHSTPPQTPGEDDIFLGGLSPRPVIHKSEIGRAIG